MSNEQTIVEFACGCRRIIETTENNKDKLIAWYESTRCYDCQSKQTAEANKLAGFIPLKGTEKQIVWAENIRSEAIAEVIDAIAKVDLKNPSSIARAELVVQYLKTRSEAKYWIEKRNRTVIHWIAAANDFIKTGSEGVHTTSAVSHIFR